MRAIAVNITTGLDNELVLLAQPLPLVDAVEVVGEAEDAQERRLGTRRPAFVPSPWWEGEGAGARLDNITEVWEGEQVGELREKPITKADVSDHTYGTVSQGLIIQSRSEKAVFYFYRETKAPQTTATSSARMGTPNAATSGRNTSSAAA